MNLNLSFDSNLNFNLNLNLNLEFVAKVFDMQFVSTFPQTGPKCLLLNSNCLIFGSSNNNSISDDVSAVPPTIRVRVCEWGRGLWQH